MTYPQRSWWIFYILMDTLQNRNKMSFSKSLEITKKRKNKLSQRDPVAKELLTDTRYRHLVQKSKKERIHKQELEEWEKELKEYDGI